MIRIRFHGRGGQGMKTASRIVGTAAVLDGLEAQDSPVYGAERRGAPMTAYTRIATAPILERGVIPVPDLVVVADDTLFDDPAARPLAGLPPTGALLCATRHPAEEVGRYTKHPGIIVARDFLTLALDTVGSAAGGSAALGSATCALLGLRIGAATEALRRELTSIGLSPSQIAANLRLAELSRTGLEPIDLPSPPAAVGRDSPVVDVTYARPEVGTPSVRAEPNTPLRMTGSWRVFRPVIDLDKCTRCWVCFVWCPEGAIDLDDADRPIVDYLVCKGCLICAEECPTHAIARVRESREWVRAEATP